MNVTLKDIANKLGISHSTVSLALNNSPKVAEATREKILLTAKEMGYKASPYVSALMTARRKGKDPKDAPVIAIVTANRTPDYWKNNYHMERFIAGCAATAQSLGIRIEHFWLGEKGMSAKRLNDILYNRGIRGAIFLSHGRAGAKMDYPWKDLAPLTFGVRNLIPETDWVGADLYGHMEVTLKILREQNYKRIGFAMDRIFPYQHHNRWLSAYVMERQLGNIEPLEVWMDQEPSYEGFSKWIMKTEPEVVVCLNGPQVIDWLSRMEYKVPDEVGVVTVNTAVAGGEITGIVENNSTCAKVAMEMLIDRIHKGQFGSYESPEHIVIQGEWNPGRSLKVVS